MRIEKLVMTGFKSFADRTEFEFGEGLTALVGPNGCGKSNVVDAIKWVLGEQRPTSLRSKEMADVIFNGNSTRKSMGFCEVKLFIDNKDGRLPVEFDEICIPLNSSMRSDRSCKRCSLESRSSLIRSICSLLF